MLLEARKVLNREKILEVTISLFAQKSMRATTISEIASAAGVVDQTVLNIFGAKYNLVLARI